MNNSANERDNFFDTMLVVELKSLREGEERLQRLYRQLPQNPQLHEFFLGELSEIQRRADRLSSVLTPYESLEPVATLGQPTLMPAA